MQIEEGREEKKELAMLLVCLPSLLHHCAATQGTNDELMPGLTSETFSIHCVTIHICKLKLSCRGHTQIVNMGLVVPHKEKRRSC